MKLYSDLYSIKGRIAIEEQNYEDAAAFFDKALSFIEEPDPKLLLLSAYAHYLIAEYNLPENTSVYKKKLSLCISKLNTARNMLIQQHNSNDGIMAYTLFLLGYIYFKCNDLVSSKGVLSECVCVSNAEETTIRTKNDASEMLNYIWEQHINPPFWRWWLFAPVNSSLKQIGFITCLFFLAGGLLPSCMNFFVSSLIKTFLYLFQVGNYFNSHSFAPFIFDSATIRIIYLIVLLGIIMLPNIQKIKWIKVKDYEVELKAPPPLFINLSPARIGASLLEETGKPNIPNAGQV